jgi:hypothetical protein
MFSELLERRLGYSNVCSLIPQSNSPEIDGGESHKYWWEPHLEYPDGPDFRAELPTHEHTTAEAATHGVTQAMSPNKYVHGSSQHARPPKTGGEDQLVSWQFTSCYYNKP